MRNLSKNSSKSLYKSLSKKGKKRLHSTGLLLLASLAIGVRSAQAQNSNSEYIAVQAGMYSAREDVVIPVIAPQQTRFILRKVLNPQELLSNSQDPSNPEISKSIKTRFIKSYRTKTLKESNNRRRERSFVDLGTLTNGVYLLQYKELNAVIVVSNLGLVTKRGENSLLAYLADAQTGQVRNGQAFYIKTPNKASPETSTAQKPEPQPTVKNATAKQGVAYWPKLSADAKAKSSDDAGKYNSNDFVVAQSGNDWAVSGSYWNNYRKGQQLLGYIYSDRSVYRPAQKVELKGVLRHSQSRQPWAKQPVTLIVEDPNGEEILRQDLTSNQFGSVAASLDLRQSSRVGTYRARLKTKDSTIYGQFIVEAYQKPEYQVEISASNDKLVQGQTAQLQISANYLFGGAVAGGKVKYRVLQSMQTNYDGYYYNVRHSGSNEKLIMQKSARLDASGQLKLELPIARNEDGDIMQYRVEADVEDEARRPLSAQTNLTAYPSAVLVESAIAGYSFDTGKPVSVKLKTTDLAGKGVAATVELELWRHNWQDRKQKEEKVWEKTSSTDATGRLNTTVTAPQSGRYTLKVKALDAKGRLSHSQSYFWAYREGESWNWYSADGQIELIPDKDSYQVGETASILLMNPQPATPMLLSQEGQDVQPLKLLTDKSNAIRYTFKVTSEMAPNLHLSAISLKDGEVLSGRTNLKIKDPAKRLSISIQSDKTQYQPQDKATFAVQVKNSKGEGVASEVAFGVVDQAIYLLRPDKQSSLLEVFEKNRPNRVRTSDSNELRWMPAELGERPKGFYGNSMAMPKGVPMTTAPAPSAGASMTEMSSEASAAGDEQAQAAVPVRSDFRDTLLWLPQLITDASGKAEVSFRMPDNLTTWVSTARAHTIAPQYGEATQKTLTTKDVVARLITPPFLVRGDQSTIAGIVNNRLDKTLKGSAQLELGELLSNASSSDAASNKLGQLNIPPYGRQRLSQIATAAANGQAQLTFTARSDGGNDALRLPLPIKARGYARSTNLVFSGPQKASFSLPADTAPKSVRLRLDLTPSLLSAVAPALEYLIGYPYGCSEQTMSRFLPALLARQSLGANLLPAEVRQNLDKYSEIGLARLLKFQHNDGGWGFWEHDNSTLEMTAYVMEGLLRAQDTGLKIEKAVLQRGLQYLSSQSSKPLSSKIGEASKARALKVLAMGSSDNKPQNDPNNINKQLTKNLADFAAQDLQPYAVAQLALAYAELNEPAKAQQLLSKLKNQAQSQRNGAIVYWKKEREQNQAWYWYWDDNSNQVSAAALEALATLEPNSPLIPKVSQWLLLQRKGQKWLSTQDTTSVIIAALKLPSANSTTGQVEVLLNGQSLGQVEIKDQRSATLEKAVQLGAGKHQLELKGAPSQLISAAQLDYSQEPPQLRAENNGIALTREYQRLNAEWDAKSNSYRYKTTPLADQTLKVGDLVRVKLTVEAQNDARYLMVSDPIPAGTKALDDRSLVLAGSNEPQPRNWWEWNYWYAGRDLLDDRVDLYADFLEGGRKRTLSYVLRVQTAGVFTALPSHAFLMYEPDVEGYSAAKIIRSQE